MSDWEGDSWSEQAQLTSEKVELLKVIFDDLAANFDADGTYLLESVHYRGEEPVARPDWNDPGDEAANGLRELGVDPHDLDDPEYVRLLEVIHFAMVPGTTLTWHSQGRDGSRRTSCTVVITSDGKVLSNECECH